MHIQMSMLSTSSSYSLLCVSWAMQRIVIESMRNWACPIHLNTLSPRDLIWIYLHKQCIIWSKYGIAPNPPSQRMENNNENIDRTISRTTIWTNNKIIVATITKLKWEKKKRLQSHQLHQSDNTDLVFRAVWCYKCGVKSMHLKKQTKNCTLWSREKLSRIVFIHLMYAVCTITSCDFHSFSLKPLITIKVYCFITIFDSIHSVSSFLFENQHAA